MLALLLAASVTPFPDLAPSAPRPHAHAVHPFGDDKPLKALDAWLKHYRSGKMNFRSDANISKDAIASKYGLTGKAALGNATWKSDLETILEAVVQLQSAAAAEAMLEVTAIGIDAGKYEYEQAPYDVRGVAETYAARFVDGAAKEVFAKAARGEIKVDKPRMTAFQTAGVRVLGLLKDTAHRPTLEQALGDGDEIVRISAAESLGALGDDTAALALIALIERDTSDAVLVAAAQSLCSLYAQHVPKAGAAESPLQPSKDKVGEAAGSPPAPAARPAAPELPESVRLAVRAAIKALGRTTWRADMALLRLLDQFRSLETVPALIGVLERFAAHPEELKSGKLSGLLLYQTHELLVSMTGAVFPADQPAKWRELWETEKDKLEVTKRHEPQGAATTVASGFCGIPVQGTRVVFVLDLSGSMDFNMDEVATDGKKKLSKRIDFAKRELCNVIDGISPNAQFNLITFNGDDEAEAWKKELVLATEKNREAFKKHVNGLRALGGTNLWSGLADALKMKSLVYGNHYETNIDELFVVSDGAPSVGEVQEPAEILRLVAECNKFAKVRINTIYISSQAPEDVRRAEARMKMRPQELMRRMAEENGGKFKEL